VAILREAQGLVTGRKGEPVFPGLKGKPLSDMTLSKALRVAGGVGATVHGMRSAFRDWVAEMMPTVPGDVAEAALAHKIANKTEAAYRRAKYLDQRRDLMERWAAYLGGCPSNVISLVAANV
jgi:integrase